MRERIIILGAGVMQGPAIRIAKELGFFTVVVDGSANAPCIAMADHFEQIDLKDKEGIEAFACSLQTGGGLGGIMTAGTDFSATVAWVAERLKLPGIPYEAALNASDKARMRACFKKAGLPSPEFAVITNTELPAGSSTSLDRALERFPLVVKPVDNMGGRGCRRVNNIEEFREAAADAINFSRSGRAIAESFMDGPEFSVDAIVYHGEIIMCGLADRHIFFPPCFIEMGHTMPTVITPEQQETLFEIFDAGIRALGLAGKESIGAAKGDIKLLPQGPSEPAVPAEPAVPMIGEIAARLSGGYMSGWTYPYSSGAEPIRAAILAAMGRKPDGLTPLKSWTSAERAFISIPGTVKTVNGIEAARSRQHIRELFLRVAEGGKVKFPENNVSKCGNVISAAPDRGAAVEAAENAIRSILIRLDPHDEETADFLFPPPETIPPAFPPDAFQLDPALKAALFQLPETVINHAAPEGESLFIVSFPEFAVSGMVDYVGRTVAESLAAARELTGLSLPEISQENTEFSDNQCNLLGKSFWAAFVRGGYQGAVYYIDRLGGQNGIISDI